MALVEHDGLPALHPREHLPRVGPEGADDDTIVDRVRAQHVVRIPMPPRDDQLDLLLDRHARRRSFRCPLGAIEATSRASLWSPRWHR